ncbi:MAG: hypothetical protein QOJ25_2243 [Solirubrobacteraceae bacterium]|jgi:hypothetical protein|nr:hypothetical protein [Solirubrobacteraceae bacterium]
MTEHRSFKRLVRARMEKTGESYTAARANLLRAEEPKEAEVPRLKTSDETIRQRTGRGWEEWFALLDEWGAPERTHREIARWVAEQQGVVPLAWNAQAVAGSYELARGLRAVGEKPDGFAITSSKTVAVPVERLFDAFVDPSLRERWLPDGELRARTTTRPKSARFDWGDGGTRVHVTFLAKGEAKSTAALEHRRLADAEQAERMKDYWRRNVAALKELLER